MVNQIKNWVNTRQISSATQKDNSTIFRQAEKQKWTKRKRKGRGGGYEYLVDELPQNIQQALAKRDAEQTFNSLNNDSAYFLAGKTIAKNINQNKELSADDKHRIMENGAAQLMQLQGKKRLKTHSRTLRRVALENPIEKFTTRKMRRLFRFFEKTKQIPINKKKGTLGYSFSQSQNVASLG